MREISEEGGLESVRAHESASQLFYCLSFVRGREDDQSTWNVLQV